MKPEDRGTIEEALKLYSDHTVSLMHKGQEQSVTVLSSLLVCVSRNLAALQQDLQQGTSADVCGTTENAAFKTVPAA